MMKGSKKKVEYTDTAWLVKEVVALAIDIHNGTKHDVLVNISGHCPLISVRIFVDGWTSREPEFEADVTLNSEDSPVKLHALSGILNYIRSGGKIHAFDKYKRFHETAKRFSGMPF